jgi:hypothetical protein
MRNRAFFDPDQTGPNVAKLHFAETDICEIRFRPPALTTSRYTRLEQWLSGWPLNNVFRACAAIHGGGAGGGR